MKFSSQRNSSPCSLPCKNATHHVRSYSATSSFWESSAHILGIREIKILRIRNFGFIWGVANGERNHFQFADFSLAFDSWTFLWMLRRHLWRSNISMIFSLRKNKRHVWLLVRIHSEFSSILKLKLWIYTEFSCCLDAFSVHSRIWKAIIGGKWSIDSRSRWSQEESSSNIRKHRTCQANYCVSSGRESTIESWTA